MREWLSGGLTGIASASKASKSLPVFRGRSSDIFGTILLTYLPWLHVRRPFYRPFPKPVPHKTLDVRRPFCEPFPKPVLRKTQDGNIGTVWYSCQMFKWSLYFRPSRFCHKTWGQSQGVLVSWVRKIYSFCIFLPGSSYSSKSDCIFSEVYSRRPRVRRKSRGVKQAVREKRVCVFLFCCEKTFFFMVLVWYGDILFFG